MRMDLLSKRKGFTLIELLIVVAIIAILAAIAVPNFLEAQVRSKVSRAKADMRTVATAVEAYFVDNNKYPYTLPAAVDLDGYGNLRQSDTLTVPDIITSPIAYITSHVPDVFKVGKKINAGFGGASPSAGRPYQSGDAQDMTFLWLNMAQAGPGPGDPGLGFGFFSSAAEWQFHFDQWGWWQMRSMGPTGLYPGAPGFSASFRSVNAIYDPTNGTVSTGMIIRNQKSGEGKQQ